MRVLLDTNIIIHREAGKVIHGTIGLLFRWLDKLHYIKCIHPLTSDELNKYSDISVVKSMKIKLDSYTLLKTQAPINEIVQQVSDKIDVTENDLLDTKLLNEVFCERVDVLISEDKKIHTKAALLDINNKVFKIDTFLEKVINENPDLIDYDVLSVKQELFGNININDEFFDSFREDYKGFNEWFNKKSDETCYICFDNGLVTAFLYIKAESADENYSDIIPILNKQKRLKIGTFKVINNGVKLGERFLKIIFDNALKNKVEEIYVTIFSKRPEQIRLIHLLQDWGFKHLGIKSTINGEEQVFVKPFKKNIEINIDKPKLSFPFLSRNTDKYIVKIEPQYHTELFPDSRLNTESAMDFIENLPHRNGLSKVYISHSKERSFKSGDILIFYRIGETSPKIYSSTVTTIGIVESINDKIPSFDELRLLCRKKTVISDDDLRVKFWDKYGTYRPFIINFIYAHSFPMPKPSLKDLNEIGIIPDVSNIPKGFIKITNPQFRTLIKFAYKR